MAFGYAIYLYTNYKKVGVKGLKGKRQKDWMKILLNEKKKVKISGRSLQDQKSTEQYWYEDIELGKMKYIIKLFHFDPPLHIPKPKGKH